MVFTGTTWCSLCTQIFASVKIISVTAKSKYFIVILTDILRTCGVADNIQLTLHDNHLQCSVPERIINYNVSAATATWRTLKNNFIDVQTSAAQLELFRIKRATHTSLFTEDYYTLKPWLHIAIRLRYDYDTTIPRRTRLRWKWSKLRFHCDTTTTRLRYVARKKLTCHFFVVVVS